LTARQHPDIITTSVWKRLVFAPTKYLDQEHLDQYRIDFAQLPFEIYELAR